MTETTTDAKVDYFTKSGSGPSSAYVDIVGDFAIGSNQHSDSVVTLVFKDGEDWHEIEPAAFVRRIQALTLRDAATAIEKAPENYPISSTYATFPVIWLRAEADMIEARA
jgi:hypothetical protein